MPQGSTTTARHVGAESAQYRFDSNHALQLAATDLEYEVTRVKSPVLGRDLNPMGRGDGTYYCNGGNGAPSGSVAIWGAKPRFVGERVTGYGSNVNNQCCGAAGAGVGPGSQPSSWGIDPIIPPLVWWPKYGWDYKKGLEDGVQVKLYFNPLMDACKSNSSPHCDLYTYDHAQSSYSHQCCSNACYREDAIKVAKLINEHCKGSCFAFVAMMARTFKEQTQKPEPPIWGIYVVFGCHPSEWEQYKNVPLVMCWCKVRASGDMPGLAFMECLQSVLGVRPGCTVGVAGGGGGGNGGEDGDYCSDICQWMSEHDSPCELSILAMPEATADCVADCVDNCKALLGNRAWLEPDEKSAIEGVLDTCCLALFQG